MGAERDGRSQSESDSAGSSASGTTARSCLRVVRAAAGIGAPSGTGDRRAVFFPLSCPTFFSNPSPTLLNPPLRERS